jgi:uncharacterized protein YdhG (YjbR/CyaY superfamily)
VHVAGFKKHIGFFPTPEAIVAFQEQLTQYKTSKGTIQFPLDKPIPYDFNTKNNTISYRYNQKEQNQNCIVTIQDLRMYPVFP